MTMPKLADKRALGEVKCQTCSEEGGPAFHLGLDTYRVPYALHEVNRAKVAQAMVTALSDGDEGAEVGGVLLLAGGDQQTRYDTDHEPLFRQESYFQYLFGVSEAGVTGAVALPSGAATLFVPNHGVDYEVFCGRYPSPADFKLKYGVEEVLYHDELAGWLEAHGVETPAANREETATGDVNRAPGDGNLVATAEDAAATTAAATAAEASRPKLHLLWGQNSDSGNWAMPARLPFDGNPDKWAVDRATLFKCLAEARVVKSDAEIEVMRYVNWVSSMAHVEVMRAAKPGMMEYQLESLFLHHTYTHGGCRHSAYSCICACGPSPAVLHYGHAGRPNDCGLAAGDLALLDMGAEYHCYASDVTCSFPIGGAFSTDQRAVYGAVLAAQVAVYAAMAPGVLFSALHLLAERTLLEHLWAAGILTSGHRAGVAVLVGRNAAGDGLADGGEGDAFKAAVLDAMQAADLGAVFMPHGLGHLIGLDTHDVGGYLGGAPPRPTRAGSKRLRTARPLEAGMVVTVEPGCYFIDPLLDAALARPDQARFLNPARLARLRGTGGVRLEDDVRVKAAAPFVDNLTLCPRTVAEVEAVLAGGAWPPAQDAAPELHRRWSKPAKGGAGMRSYEL